MTANVDQVDDYFGTQVADPYRWLEDDKSAETAAWVKAQNEVTFGCLQKIPFRDALKKRLAGRLDKKQNVFDDFIAAAEYLIAEKYASSAKSGIEGGSNGGLLVGAVMTQRPELFKVELPAVGVMDMLRFHKFTVGWGWAVEYGSSDNEKDFKWLSAYSPLHNIKAGVAYPATLATTADHDDRVAPAHSFKFISTLQEKHKGANPVPIRIETRSGHGSSNVSKAIEITADEFAFFLFNRGAAPKFK